MPWAEKEATQNDEKDSADFYRSKNDLHCSAKFHAQVVDGSDEEDSECGEWLGEGENEFRTCGMDDKERSRYDWKQETEKTEKAGGERGHGDGTIQKSAHPTEKKSPEGTEAATEIDIRAARFWKHCAKLGIAKGTEQNDEASENPGNKNKRGRADGARHVAGDEKNSGADGVADDDSSRSPKAQAAD